MFWRKKTVTLIREEEPGPIIPCASKRTRGKWISWRSLFACVGRRVRSEAVHTGQWEKPAQGVGEKKEEGNLS